MVSITLRLLLAGVFIFMSAPFAALAETGTPVAPPPVVEEEPEAARPLEEETVEPAEDPLETPTETATEPPTGDDEASGDTIEEPIGKSTRTAPSSLQNTGLSAQEEEATSALWVYVHQCGNDEKAGTFEFLRGRVQTFAANTSYDCERADISQMTATLTPAGGGDLVTGYAYSSTFDFWSVPSGNYTLTITAGEHTGSTGIMLEPDAYIDVDAFYFVAAEPQPAPDREGEGIVVVFNKVCADIDRAGETDFLVYSTLLQPRLAAVPECTWTPVPQGRYALTDTNDGSVIGDPVHDQASDAIWNVPAGSYTLTDLTNDNTSAPFTVSDGALVDIHVIAWVSELPPLPVDVWIQKQFCEDDDRIGETDFIRDTISFGPYSTGDSSTCLSQPSGDEWPAITIVFTNVDDAGETYPVTLDTDGQAELRDLPGGTYTVTEIIDGGPSITSGPIEFPGSDFFVLRIINYVAETERPEPDVDGEGDIYAAIFFCESAEREEGDVDFIIHTEDGGIATFALTTCEGFLNASGLVALYPVDPDTGVIDTDAGQLFNRNEGFVSLYGIAAGYYVIGYIDPATGIPTYSEPFPLYGNGRVDAEINVFSAPVYLGFIDIAKEFCVDPARAGDASFRIERFGWSDSEPVSAIAAASAPVTECRSSGESDAPISYTLTNTETGRTRTSESSSYRPAEGWFSSVPGGTYTLTEHGPDGDITSQPFTFDPLQEELYIAVRNFIAERDWPADEDKDHADFAIAPFICTSQNRDGGGVFFTLHSGPVDQPGDPDAISGDTADCRNATESDGLVFEAVPQDGDRDPIPFVFEGWWYVPDTDDEKLPPGDYVIIETTSGISSGVIRANGWTFVEFLRFEPHEVTEASVTINVTSADPDVADTLPADAKWTVSQGGVTLFTDTFAAEHLGLPASIPVTRPVPYGEYDVTINAGPTFLAYTNTFTVDAPAEVVEIELEPVTEASVTVTVRSTDPQVADTLPAAATWTILQDGETLFTDTFSTDHLALPAGITVTKPVPFGTYQIEIDAGPAFEAYTATWQVHSPSQAFVADLIPVRSLPTATFSVASGNPAIANTLPAGSTWTITSEDGDIEITGSWDDETALPTSVDSGETLSFSQFTMSIDAGNAFEPLREPFQVLLGTHDLGTFTLVPVEEGQGTIVALNVASADPDIADRLPDDATWSVTSAGDPDLVISDVFADGQRDLPRSIPLETPLPDGDYIVEVSAGPTFAPYREVFSLDAGADGTASQALGFLAFQQALPDVSWGIVLQPVPADPDPAPTPTAPANPDPTPTPTVPVDPDPTPTPTPTVPVDPATPEPTDPATPEPTGTATATPPATPGTPTPEPGVKGLPSTGQGTANATVSTALILAASGALLAAIGGLAIRRKRA